MGIDLAIEDENGKTIATSLDSGNRFSASLRSTEISETHCLQYIAPYSDTVFNVLQIPRLLQELDRLKLSLSNSTSAELVSIFSELIRSYSDKPAIFVKFYGD